MDSTKNHTFEQSWSRLETALNVDESYLYTESRPKTTASLRKCSLASHRIIRSTKLQSTSISRSFNNGCKRPITTSSRYTQKVPGLTILQVQLIYAAKCRDINIPVLSDQEKRFVNFCTKNFSQRALRIKEAGLGKHTAKVIGDVLKTSEYFAYVDLSKNLLKDEGAVQLVKRLAGSNSLVHLDISSNEVSPEGNEQLLEILAEHASLVSLDISSHEGLHRNRLAVVGSRAAGRLLKVNKILTMLNLAGTGIGPEGLELIVEGLKNNVTLSYLNIANNNIKAKPIEMLAAAVVGTDLRELNLSFNGIGNEGCEFLGLMLSGGYNGYCMLAKLDIMGNEISTAGLAKILAALRINSQLSHLSCKKNDFSKGLSHNFSQFLVENVSIQSLDFSCCEITCDGLQGIAEGLSKNSGLLSLNLSNNEISDKGADLFFQGLCKNKTLKHLDLSSNQIKDRGGLLLAQAMQENDTIESLQLKSNSLKDDSAQKFSELSRWKRNILKLRLDLNPLNFKYLDIIKNNVKSNYLFKQKSLVPKLQEIVDKLQFKGTALEDLHVKITMKQKERNEIEMRLRSKGVKLDDVKAAEEAKLMELKNEYIAMRELSQKLSHEIEEANSQITKVRIHEEKAADDLNDKFAIIVKELNEIEKKKIDVKEQIAEKKSHHENIYHQVIENLKTEEIAKRSAESTITNLRKKLEEKKTQIEIMKNPRAFKTELVSNYLASEKLASSKKKTSVSPIKQPFDLNVKRVKRRVKSVIRKTKKN